jgi:hypothetical protein
MAIKRTVMLAGVSSAVLIVGSSGFAFANGILGGRRADPVGSYVPVATRLADETQPAGPAPSHRKAAPPLVGSQPTTSVATGEDGDDAVEHEPRPITPIPVTAPAPPVAVGTPPTMRAAEPGDDEPGDEYTTDDTEHEPEHEDEAVIDDDHHGRDDDD